MKNSKFIKLSLAVITLLYLLIFSVSAAIGDVVGHTTYTDIKAYINHYAIQSYNVDGYTVVVAEDLADFGFDVVWDQNTRSLSVTRNPIYTKITQTSIPTETSPNLFGKTALDILETDIKTYVNGVEVKSYNINGRTVIDFGSLSCFGSVIYDNTYRVIKLWVTDGLEMRETEQSFTPLPKYELYSANGDTIEVYDYQINDYLKVGWYSTASEARAAKEAEQAAKKAAEEAKEIEKNKSLLKNFYVGQNVNQWLLFYSKYGVVQKIDYNTGKILVYWNYIEDGYGQPLDAFSGRVFGMYSEEWVDASSLSRTYY